MMKKIYLILFLIGLFSQGFSQRIVYFDTYNTNDALVEEVFDVVPLSSGVTYDLKVTGTYSIWRPSYWSSPCGALETAPIFPSAGGYRTGPVGSDMEYFFALPNGSVCNRNTLPLQTTRIEISLDSGATWFHPVTQDPLNLAHTYTYQIVGQGFPIAIRHTSALNSDDYGQLEFSMAPVYNTNPCPKLVVSPNPASTRVEINLDITLIHSITITSLGGRRQTITYGGGKQNQTLIDISNLLPGVYIVTVWTEFGKKTVKLVVK